MTKSRSRHPMLAQALKNLRLRNGVPVKTFNDSLRRTKQEISRWENDERPFPEDLVAPYMAAIGVSEEELAAELQRLESATDEAAPAAPPWQVYFPPHLEMILNRDETMSPWSEQGEKVFYEPGRPPKRMDGCVVEMADGRRLIRQYERSAEGHVFVKSLNPDRTESYLWSEIKGLHRIFVRGD